MATVYTSLRCKIQIENGGVVIYEGDVEFQPKPNDEISFTDEDSITTVYKIEKVTTELTEIRIPAQNQRSSYLTVESVIIVDISVVP